MSMERDPLVNPVDSTSSSSSDTESHESHQEAADPGSTADSTEPAKAQEDPQPTDGGEAVSAAPEEMPIPEKSASMASVESSSSAEPAEQPPTENSEASNPEAATPAASSSESNSSDSSQGASTEPKSRPRVRLNPKLPAGMAVAVPSLGHPSGPVETQQPKPEPAKSEASPEESVEASIPSPAESSAPSAAPPPPPSEPVDIPEPAELDADMEAQIAAAMQADPAVASVEVTGADAALAESSAAPDQEISAGDKLQGTVQSVDGDNVFLDLGLRFTGLVPLRQFDPQKQPAVGQALEVKVDKIDETEGLVHVSLPRGRAQVSGDWSAVSAGQSVECRVTKTNKGGLEVTVGNLRGFIPASQVDLRFVSDLETYVGQQLAARVVEVNPARRRLVLSRRQLLEEERAASEQEIFSSLTNGEIRQGTVKTIKDYGAFVDIGGIDGFLHISQISWRRINHPSEELQVGQAIDVKVTGIDQEKKRVSLSMRQLEQNPWSQAESKYEKGSTVEGRVTRIEPFGAFVELEPGIEGLIHISEIDHKRIHRVEDVLQMGQTVTVQVLEVDRKRKRISLSMKALIAAPEPPPEEASSLGKAERQQRQRKRPLKGGMGSDTAGGLFGNPSDFT